MKTGQIFENLLDSWSDLFRNPQMESLKVRIHDPRIQTNAWICDTNPRVHDPLIQIPQP